MGLYKRGNIWWMAFTHKGKQVHQTTKQKDRRLAEAFAASFRAAVQENRFIPSQKECGLSEVLHRYREIHLKASHPASYAWSKYTFKKMLLFFGGDAPVSKLRPEVDRYKAWRRETVKASSARRELEALKAATHKALEWQMISQDPLAGYKLDKLNNQRVRYIEDDEFQRLVNAAHPSLSPVLIIARHLGMRQGEIRKLDWSDIDLKGGRLHIRQAKSGEGRYIPLTSLVINMLSQTPLSERAGYVFTHHGKELLKDGFIRNHFRKAVKLAGLMDFTFHDLRHTWASHAAMRGIDVQSMATILGHKTLRMTQRYSHLSPGFLKASIELAAPKVNDPLLQNYYSRPLSRPADKPAIGPQTEIPSISRRDFLKELVELKGFEPSTSSLRTKRSPS